MAKAPTTPLPPEQVLYLRRNFKRGSERVSVNGFAARSGIDRKRMRDLLSGRTYKEARGPIAIIEAATPRTPSPEEVLYIRRCYRRGAGRVSATTLAAWSGIGVARMRMLLVGRKYGKVGALDAMFSKGARRCLSDQQVAAMRRLYRDDVEQTIATLAPVYGVSDKAITQILTGVTYKHVPGALSELRPATWSRKARVASQKARRIFTVEQVITARREYDPPRVNATAIAKRLGANVSTVIKMLDGTSYPEIEGAREVVTTPFLSPTPDLSYEQVIGSRDVYARGMRTVTQIARKLGITHRQTERMLYGHTHRDWPGALLPGTKPKRSSMKILTGKIQGVRRTVQPVRPDHSAARFVCDA